MGVRRKDVRHLRPAFDMCGADSSGIEPSGFLVEVPTSIVRIPIIATTIVIIVLLMETLILMRITIVRRIRTFQNESGFMCSDDSVASCEGTVLLCVAQELVYPKSPLWLNKIEYTLNHIWDSHTT